MIARPAHDAFLWAVAAPLLFCWGLGTAHPVLDLLSSPAAVLLAAPAFLGIPGIVAVVAVIALGRRSRGLDRLLAGTGMLSLLAPSLAASRPLPWVAVGCALLARWGWRGADRDEVMAGPAEARAWSLPELALPWLGALAWALASRALPWGTGLLPDPAATALGVAVELLPPRGAEILPLLVTLLLALPLSRRAAPAVRGAVVGMVLALLATATFGSRSAWISAAAIGALAGAWPVPLDRSPLRAVPPMLTICLLCALRMGATERWNCEAAGLDRGARWWMTDPDVGSIAVVPGNLPFLVAMTGDGKEILRTGTNGLVDETARLDPPGGRLLGSGQPGPFARVLDEGGGARVEWWDAAPLRMATASGISPPCRARDARMLPSAEVLIECDGRGLVGLSPGKAEPRDLGGPGLSPQGASVALRRGPFAAAVATHGERVLLGPWTEGLGQGPESLFVARGPTGQVEVRGAGPPIPGREEERAVRDRALLHRIQDRARVGAWPGTVAFSAWQQALYVASPVDGRIWLVDPLVTWQAKSTRIGAPPRQVVIDPASGTLYGVNRCGVFEVRIKSTFPWGSTGDVEPDPEPAGAGAAGSATSTQDAGGGAVTPSAAPPPAHPDGPGAQEAGQ